MKNHIIELFLAVYSTLYPGIKQLQIKIKITLAVSFIRKTIKHTYFTSTEKVGSVCLERINPVILLFEDNKYQNNAEIFFQLFFKRIEIFKQF